MRKPKRPPRGDLGSYFAYQPVFAVAGTHYGKAAFARDIAKLGMAPARHKALFHVAANAGSLIAGGELDEMSAVVVLEASARRLGLPESEIRRTIKDGLRRGMRNPRRADETGTRLNGRQEAREKILRWWEFVAAQDWSGRTGPTVLKILGGFAKLAMQTAKLRLTQSYRELAEAAGVSVGTISKHEVNWSRYVAVVQKGSRLGFARVERQDGSKTNRSVFQLLVTRADGNRPEADGETAVAGLFPQLQHTQPPTASFPMAGTLADPAADTWHGRSSAWRLWITLPGDEYADDAAVARALGRRRWSVSRTLRFLEREGLVECDGDNSWRRVETASPASMTAHAERRRERHVRDRQSFFTYLEGRGLHVRWDAVSAPRAAASVEAA